MAVKSYTEESLQKADRIITWTPLANGDTGGWYVCPPRMALTSFQVYGTFGTGGSVSLEGTNETGSPTQNPVLKDVNGTAITLTAAGINNKCGAVPYQIRPHCTAGDGTTALTVKLQFSVVY